MSALTTCCTNPKILLASPGASTHVPNDTGALSTKRSFPFAAKLLREILISWSLAGSGGQHAAICRRDTE
jgi:hypothetical protein